MGIHEQIREIFQEDYNVHLSDTDTEEVLEFLQALARTVLEVKKPSGCKKTINEAAE